MAPAPPKPVALFSLLCSAKGVFSGLRRNSVHEGYVGEGRLRESTLFYLASKQKDLLDTTGWLHNSQHVGCEESCRKRPAVSGAGTPEGCCLQATRVCWVL